MIQRYAPTNSDNEEAKDDFYTRLQNVLDETSKRDIIILMGDTNAKVGSDNPGREEEKQDHQAKYWQLNKAVSKSARKDKQ